MKEEYFPENIIITSNTTFFRDIRKKKSVGYDKCFEYYGAFLLYDEDEDGELELKLSSRSKIRKRIEKKAKRLGADLVFVLEDPPEDLKLYTGKLFYYKRCSTEM